MISDGAPVDDSRCRSTPQLPERHLRHIIEEIEDPLAGRADRDRIGHDVTRYYRRAAPSSMPKSSAAPTEKLAELFDETHGPSPPHRGHRRRLHS